jgi:hypothetical protein
MRTSTSFSKLDSLMDDLLECVTRVIQKVAAALKDD